MAAEEEKRVFRPIRSETILNGQGEHPGYPEDDIERPATDRNDSSTDVEDKLERVVTTQSMRNRREYEPIIPGDREELERIASRFSGRAALSRTSTAMSGGLERKDTLAGISLGDAVLDPGSPEFDVYKWSKM